MFELAVSVARGCGATSVAVLGMVSGLWAYVANLEKFYLRCYTEVEQSIKTNNATI